MATIQPPPLPQKTGNEQADAYLRRIYEWAYLMWFYQTNQGTDATGEAMLAGRGGLMFGADGADGEDGLTIVGPQGLRGLPGLTIPGLDGQDGEDGQMGSPGPQGLRGAPGQFVPGMDGQDADDWQMPMPIKAPDAYRLQGRTWEAPGAIGSGTPNTGAFSTISATDTITPAQVKGIVGTTTNNDAQAGSVGEYISGQLASPGNALTTSTMTNVVSISLTAGDWDVIGVVGFAPAATTSVTYFFCGITTTSATLGPQGTYVDVNQAASVPVGGFKAETPLVRLSLSATTTVYLIGYMNFTVSTATIFGDIRARRIR